MDKLFRAKQEGDIEGKRERINNYLKKIPQVGEKRAEREPHH